MRVHAEVPAELLRRVALAPHDLPDPDDLVPAADQIFLELDRREQLQRKRHSRAEATGTMPSDEEMRYRKRPCEGDCSGLRLSAKQSGWSYCTSCFHYF